MPLSVPELEQPQQRAPEQMIARRPEYAYEDPFFMGRANMLGIRPFSGRNGESARSWLRKYDAFAAAMGWSDTQSFQKFRLYLTGSAADWYYLKIDLASEEERPSDYQALKELFLTSYEDLDSAYDNMLRRSQGANEDVHSYILSKAQLCMSYNEDMNSGVMIRHRKACTLV